MKKNISFVLLALWITLALAACGKTKPEGIYFIRGGLSYIEISRDQDGTYSIPGNSLLPDFTLLASLENNRLVIKTPPISSLTKFPQLPLFEVYYELLPSESTPGDWDLIRVCISPPLMSREENFDPKNTPVLQTPYPSFLHRIDDPRIVEYFKTALAEHRGDTRFPVKIPSPNAPRLVALSSELVSAHPDDLDVRTLYLDALIRKGDDTTLEKQMTALKETYEKTGNSYHQHILRMIENHLSARRLSAGGKNARDVLFDILAKDKDFPAQIQRLPELLHYEKYAEPRTDLILGIVTNYLEIQVAAKNFCVWSVFLLLRGGRKEALQILAASYHLGHLMEQGDSLISNLIGIAVRSIAARGLELYALNACETPADFEEFWNTLKRLNYPSRDLNMEEMDLLEGPLYPERIGMAQPNLTEALVRRRTSFARFHLVRMATAAKRHFTSLGSFPAKPQDFAPLLAEGPPRDPFSTEPLRFIPSSDPFACYSIGPDEKDDMAAFPYDPTNGTLSTGDIFVKIPREREYPFPRGGVHAKNAADLLRQFPNGLPPDPFADTKFKPFGIANTDPILVYSYGPDTDESQARRAGDQYIPENPYDPTNGIVSRGDIFIQIPN
jgi:hypothetical protein